MKSLPFTVPRKVHRDTLQFGNFTQSRNVDVTQLRHICLPRVGLYEATPNPIEIIFLDLVQFFNRILGFVVIDSLMMLSTKEQEIVCPVPLMERRRILPSSGTSGLSHDVCNLSLQ
jgi:hypothetical protein